MFFGLRTNVSILVLTARLLAAHNLNKKASLIAKKATKQCNRLWKWNSKYFVPKKHLRKILHKSGRKICWVHILLPIFRGHITKTGKKTVFVIRLSGVDAEKYFPKSFHWMVLRVRLSGK